MYFLYLFLVSIPFTFCANDASDVSFTAGVISLEDEPILSTLWSEFHDWASIYQKVYGTMEEKYSRMKIWAKNHRKLSFTC
jgi:hypothetical protein